MTQTELNHSVYDLLQASGLADHVQRSAIGMARTWVEKGKPIERQAMFSGYEKRDDLAEALVRLLEGSEKQIERKRALAYAREKINRPYRDKTMMGLRAGARDLSKPGDKKKKLAESNGHMK